MDRFWRRVKQAPRAGKNQDIEKRRGGAVPQPLRLLCQAGEVCSSPMTVVPLELIIKESKRIWRMDDMQADKLTVEFLTAQPHIGDFLKDFFEQMAELGKHSDESVICSLAVLTWVTLTQTIGHPPPEVGPQALLAKQEANYKEFVAMGSCSRKNRGLYRPSAQVYAQPKLFWFGVEAIVSRYLSEPDVSSEPMNLEILYFKTLLDCLARDEVQCS